MFTIVACILKNNDQILFLKRAENKSQGGKWALPAGKIEHQEAPIDAMIRELLEETGYQTNTDELEHIGEFIFNTGSPDEYCIIAYKIDLVDIISINLNQNEHDEFRWSNPDNEPIDSPLFIADLKPLIESALFE